MQLPVKIRLNFDTNDISQKSAYWYKDYGLKANTVPGRI